MYNSRDGVVTEDNGLIYMRARYYSPELRRFINADIIHGEISNAITLNRYAYANGNPVSFIDATGYFGIITLMLIGAEIGVGASVNDEGKFEIGADAGVRAGLFGLGIELAFIF